MAFEKPLVILDNGSYNIKAGFSCDNHPVSIFRTVVGRPQYLNGTYGKQDYQVCIGDDAMSKIEDYELSSPVEKGRIVHWDNMERVWHHCFYRELKVAPEDRSVLLSSAARTPLAEKVRCCEVFFETLNSPGLCIQPQGVLALYGSGYTTGMSVDLGYDTTDICSCYEGGLIKYAHMQTNLAGRQVSRFIQKKMAERDFDFGLQANDVIESIKKRMYVLKEFACVPKKDYSKMFVLPSGEEVDVGNEALVAAEMIFQPSLVCGDKCDFMPLQAAVALSALKVDPEIRPDVYNAVVPWGGLSIIPGIVERLQKEMDEIAKEPVCVLPSLEPYTVAWMGGATFAGITEAKQIWITKKQFEDHGAKIVSNKFL